MQPHHLLKAVASRAFHTEALSDAVERIDPPLNAVIMSPWLSKSRVYTVTKIDEDNNLIPKQIKSVPSKSSF